MDIVRQRGSISIGSVEELFGVSLVTARRDLTVLAQNGQVRRTHGGAVLPELASHEDSFRARLETNRTAKQRLAEAVAATVQPGESILIDSSTTAFYVARQIIASGVVATLLTNAAPVIAMVASSSPRNVDLVGLGGSLRRLTESFVGPDTVRAIGGYMADRMVFSVKGISADGFMTDPDPQQAEVKRTMLDHARTVILVATADKFEARGLTLIGSASRANLAYLADPPAMGLRMLRLAGVEVHTV